MENANISWTFPITANWHDNRLSEGQTAPNCRHGTEKEKDMKRTVSLLTAALFAGALAAPVLAQSPAMEASPAAAPSMAAPTAEGSPAETTHHHHHRHHRHHHHAATGAAPAGEMSPAGGEASPAAAPSGQ